MKINICIPVYNEEDNLSNFIYSIDNYLENFKYDFIDLDVIFFNDGSSDSSLGILSNSNYKILSELNNNGLGYAIDRLFEYSKNCNVDGVIKLDCDGQMDINEIDLFIEKIIKNKYDLIQGNRFALSKDFKAGGFKKIGMKFFSTILKLFGINIKDTSNGFIYVSKKWLENYKIIGSYNAAQQIILDTKLRKLSYSQINVTIKNRASGNSFVGIKYPFNVLASLVLLLVYRKTKYVITVPGVIILTVGILLFINDIYLWLSGSEDKVISNNIVIFMIILGIQFIAIGVITNYFKRENKKFFN